ncbi:hypothetical protein Selin_1041 [Desulfurispirillum indicum S5]|uniref:Uncharacterized protein n=1 Tax=Desulfurispirillum indicum (strain ATCC BAA-1389 / DSM 22839 / S5) TaxID=653733 RepID=E6W3I3_DESIS|nr:hypothetical protein [Desulfurispirillum indicum]ADU65776.1 hypothetical protein Selin_1041 [Desulfurispirillum indicum S5]
MVRLDLDGFLPWPQDREGMDDLLQSVLAEVQHSRDLTLTGSPPSWLSMQLAHHLGQYLSSLYYECPIAGLVEVFDHNPF